MPQNSRSVSLWQVQIESKLDMLLSTGSYFQFEFSFSMVTKDLTNNCGTFPKAPDHIGVTFPTNSRAVSLALFFCGNVLIFTIH